MKRIIIIGSGGAGKSTFARQLAAITGLPLYHLDSLYWKPNWQKPDSTDWRQTVTSLTQQNQWIIDGNYSGTLDVRVPAADLILFLDMPPYVCLWNVMKRRIRYASWTGRIRPGMPPDCPERIFFSFVKWIWQFPKHDKPKIFALIEAAKKPETPVVVLDSYQKLRLFMASIEHERSSSPSDLIAM